MGRYEASFGPTTPDTLAPLNPEFGRRESTIRAIRLADDLGFGALVVPYRNPFTVAKSIASLDQLSGGRVIVGVAPGYLENEFEAFRLPHAERGAMTDEYIRIMQAL